MPRLSMTTLILLASLLVACRGAQEESPSGTAPDGGPSAAIPAAAPYGSNDEAGETFVHDGVTLYYETYGQGEPLLVIHGNGGSIGSMAAQIEHFRSRYRVIAMDSRDQGKSGDSPTALTYEKMADDQAALLQHLEAGPAYVLGWSDGGIEALLLGIRHPEKVRRLAAMAPNLNPTEEAVYGELLDFVKQSIAAIPEDQRDTPAGRRSLKPTLMMLNQPQIEIAQLAEIAAPTLVLAGDHDLVRGSHLLEIFEGIPNSRLAIFPGSTHLVPITQPELFNTTVQRFFEGDGREMDPFADFLTALEALRAGSMD